MTIIVLECVSTSLRGHLTRWFLEVRTNIFVGTVSARVRDKVWEFITERVGTGSALLIHTARTEQGFAIRTVGDPSREIFDIDGLIMVRKPAPDTSGP